MDRVAVFVDAGYLFAEGSRALSGRRLARSAVVLDPASAVSALTRLAREQSGLSLLRIYWYDGTANRPTRAQIAVADEAGVKLRLGRIDSAGRQKGVDALMASDLVDLARNRAMADCLLLAGDDELRIAVTEIQQQGVRVHLLAIDPASRTQSPLLRREADSTREWDAGDLAPFMRCRHLDSCRACEGSAARGRKVADRVVRQVLIREFVARTGRHPQPPRPTFGLHSERGRV